MNSDNNSTANNKRCPICGQELFVSNYGAYSECSNCQYKSITHTGDLDLTKLASNLPPETNSLVNEPDNKPGGLYGWICPKCGAVMSPFVDFCPNCTNRNWEITYTTTGTTDNSITKSNLDDLGYNFEVGV